MSKREKKPQSKAEEKQTRERKDPNLRCKAYKFRLYPTKKLVNKLEWMMRRCKELYNAALQERRDAYKMGGVSVSYAMQADQLHDIKKLREEYSDIHSQVLQDVLKQLDKAFQAFFRRVSNGEKPGYPRFKSGDRDLGIKVFTMLSTGEPIENPRHYRREEEKIQASHQKVNRRKPRSHRRNRAKKELSRLYRKVRNRRRDFHHKESRKLVNRYQVIVFEDLQIQNLTAIPKPKQEEETGKYLPNGAASKAGLNKSILDAGWGNFVHHCASKAEEAGSTVVKVPPHHTSQVCHRCGTIVPKDLSVRWHSCPECSEELDRDHNSALEVLHRYQRTQKRWLGQEVSHRNPCPRVERHASCRSPQIYPWGASR